MKISFNWHKKDKSKPFGFLIEECLSKDEADKLKGIDFEKLIDFDRHERVNFLIKIVGEDKAAWLNSRIEKDFILKYQKKGLMAWVDDSPNIEPKWRKEIVRKISALEKPLDKKEYDDFLEELVGLSLGVGVTQEETQIITDLCKRLDDAKIAMDNGGSKLDFEIAQKALDDYMDMLKDD
jgi:ADP-heptose:LPS heptosyltransferase